MKLTKAEQRGSELRLRCECMDDDVPDVVFGLGQNQGVDNDMPIRQMVREFSLLHGHDTPPLKGQRLPEFEGKDLASLREV